MNFVLCLITISLLVSAIVCYIKVELIKPEAAYTSKGRLVGGTGKHEGRIEVYKNGKWGTVCDDDFDIKDGHVACKQMGFREAKSVKKFGPGSGSIHLDDLKCTGFERDLFDCPHSGIGVHDCDHSEDVGVVCTALFGYTKIDKKHCNGNHYRNFSTIQSAKDACSNDANCRGVYDQGCDAEAEDIYLCRKSATYSDSPSSCIFQIHEIECKMNENCNNPSKPYCSDDGICVGCLDDKNCTSIKPICDIRTNSCMEDVEFQKIEDKLCFPNDYKSYGGNITFAEESCRRDSFMQRSMSTRM